MIQVQVEDFEAWRSLARAFIANNVSPLNIQWHDANCMQASLFDDALAQTSLPDNLPGFKVPREFLKLSEKVACHRNPEKWALLYESLWRIVQGERHLLALATDPLVNQLKLMYKAVGRDVHKMKAFVRFKEYSEAGQNVYIAWYEPDHDIIPLVAQFFRKRFEVMHWAIFTPDGGVCWDRQHLLFTAPIEQSLLSLNDTTEDLWQTYYRAIFNPARIKLKAMRREMPVRFWRNLPETKMMHEMLLEAPSRVTKMLGSACTS